MIIKLDDISYNKYNLAFITLYSFYNIDYIIIFLYNHK